MSEWLDIDTAPSTDPDSGEPFYMRTGPRIIVSDGNHQAEVFWCDDMEAEDEEGGLEIIRGGWLNVATSEYLNWKPEKWKPSPTWPLCATETAQGRL